MIQVQFVAHQKHQHTWLQQSNPSHSLFCVPKTLSIRDAVNDQAGVRPQNMLSRKLRPRLGRHINNFHVKLSVLGAHRFRVQQIGVRTIFTDEATR